MTSLPTTVADVLAECETHGIRLLPAGDGGLTIDAPQGALTPNLLGRLRTHKGELLTLFRATPDAVGIDPPDPAAIWQAALDRLDGDPLFPPDVMEAQRVAEVWWCLF